MFIHDADNRITVNTYTVTLDNFLLSEPSYVLPPGAQWRLYVPGQKHLIGYGLRQRDGELPWPEGDAYLASEMYYRGIVGPQNPDVGGFEAALVGAFGGDFLAINSLYAGWPLFKDTLEAGQWSIADQLLTDSYVRYEITTEIYTSIVTFARLYGIPMALQGRPGLLPLNLTDEAHVMAMWAAPYADSAAVGLSEATAQIIIPIPATDSAVVAATEVAALALPIEILSDDATSVGLSDATPALVMS